MKTLIILAIISLNLYSQTPTSFEWAVENEISFKDYNLSEEGLKLITLDSLISIIDVDSEKTTKSRSLIFLELRELEESSDYSVIIATSDQNNYLLFIKNFDELSYSFFNKKQRTLVVYDRDEWWYEFKEFLNNDAKVVVVK